MKNVFVGTSGWSYAHWDQIFYPAIPSTERLSYYAEKFNTVEINTTFYHLPLPQTVKRWYAQVPKEFIFSVKASRYITHLKRLHECEEALENFYSAIQFLQEKLGPILFQLPPSFACDYEKLKQFLSLLKKEYHYAFEFRSPGWYSDEIYRLLHKNKIALCITDMNGKLSPLEVTSRFVYLRLHGPKRAYKGSYGEKKLTIWKERILEWRRQRKKVFAYFDNDEKSFATQDALLISKLLSFEKT